MSRKVFGAVGNEPVKAKTAETAAPPTPRVDPARPRPLMGSPDLLSGKAAAPVGSLGASLSQLSERGKLADDIEKRLAAGTTVVELETALIEPSFVADRMPQRAV